MIGVYKIENTLTGEMYIGQSTDIQKRFTSHRLEPFRRNTGRRYVSPLHVDMLKLGLENFDFIVLEECAEGMLNEREEFYIKLYNSVKEGYNRSEKAISLQDPKVMAKIITPEHIERNRTRFSEMNKANWQDEEYRKETSKRSSELQKRRLEDPEYRALKSAHLKQATDKKKRKIAQYTLTGELVAIHEGVRVAERDTGVKSINKHLREPDKRKQAGGFVWKYVD